MKTMLLKIKDWRIGLHVKKYYIKFYIFKRNIRKSKMFAVVYFYTEYGEYNEIFNPFSDQSDKYFYVTTNMFETVREGAPTHGYTLSIPVEALYNKFICHTKTLYRTVVNKLRKRDS